MANCDNISKPDTVMNDFKLQIDPTVDVGDPSIDCSPRKPSKRKLEEKPDDSVELPPAKTQETYVKHPDHWALDGNVLLQLGNTRFSVHRSRLTIQSSYFEALFAARSNLPFDSNDTEEIEYIVKSVEVVNGLDLFYLDYDEAPNAEEFAVLLTAMDDAIEYIHDRPPFDVIKSILIAAHFYRFDKFVKFATKCLIALFPQNVQDITSAEIPNSVEAIHLAREYDIHAILPAAFYQLARTKPSFDDDELEELKQKDFVMLSNLQKRIAFLWDDIVEIIGHNCPLAECIVIQTQRVRTIKKGCSLDPIMGIASWIQNDQWRLTKGCSVPTKEVVNKLRTARLKFWSDMEEWLDCKLEDDSD